MHRGIKPKHLPAIETLLDTENLRIFTDNALNDLEAELLELIIDVRNSPDNTPTQSISSKQSLLQNLRTASIKLNLAWDQNNIKGRTSRYYHYLSACKENLEKAYDQYNKFLSEGKNAQQQSYLTVTRRNSSEPLSLVTLLFRGQSYVRELNDAQQLLHQTYELFNTTTELWPDQCNQALSKLHATRQCIQNTLELLNNASELPPGLSPLSYELLVKLYQLDEQARILISLIASFRSICQTKSKQLTKMRGEILCKLETFEQSYSKILQNIALFIKKANNSERLHSKTHGLVLVKPVQ